MIKHQSIILSFIFVPLFVLGIYFFGQDRIEAYRKPYYFAPPDVIRHFAFGYNDVYADLLWVRYIQDADFCSHKQGLPIYDGKTKYFCDRGWAYHIAHAITELAPRFKKPYIVSGTIMGVLMGDKQGARLIFEKAVRFFPNDWEVFFHAGHHFLIELKEHEQAAQLLLRSARLGGPVWLYSLSAKLYTEAGQTAVAEKFLRKLIEDNPDSDYAEKFKKRLLAIEEKKENLEKSAPPL